MSWKSQLQLREYLASQPPSGSFKIATVAALPEVPVDRRRHSSHDRRKTPEERQIIETRQAIQDDLAEVKNDVKIVKRDVKEVKEGMK